MTNYAHDQFKRTESKRPHSGALSLNSMAIIGIVLLIFTAQANAQLPANKPMPGAKQAPNSKPPSPPVQTSQPSVPAPPPSSTVQPAPSRPQVAPQLSATQTLQKLLQAPKTTGPKIQNPRANTRVAAQSNILASLKMQMNAATAERTQMTASGSSPSIAGSGLGRGKNSSANTDSWYGQSGSSTASAGSGQGQGKNSSANTGSGAGQAGSSTASAGSGLGQGKNSTRNASGSAENAPSPKVTASTLPPASPTNRPQVQQNQAILLPCQQGKTTIFSINGAAPQAIVFTPDQEYNLYTIQGCNFGVQRGQLSLVGHFKNFTIPLTVVDWTDKGIIAGMDPNLSGELDQNKDVTFFLTRADGQRAEIDGTSFYAVRQSITLPTIPQAWVTLGTVRDVSGAALQAYYRTGPTDNSSGTAARLSTNRFSGGQDYFDFSRLNSQFSLDSMQLQYVTAETECPSGGGQTDYIDGTTTAQWDGDGIRVFLGGITCHFPSTGDQAFSVYTLQVQVTGPRGVDPTQ
jgi:hypothetical protein